MALCTFGRIVRTKQAPFYGECSAAWRERRSVSPQQATRRGAQRAMRCDRDAGRRYPRRGKRLMRVNARADSPQRLAGKGRRGKRSSDQINTVSECERYVYCSVLQGVEQENVRSRGRNSPSCCLARDPEDHSCLANCRNESSGCFPTQALSPQRKRKPCGIHHSGEVSTSWRPSLVCRVAFHLARLGGDSSPFQAMQISNRAPGSVVLAWKVLAQRPRFRDARRLV